VIVRYFGLTCIGKLGSLRARAKFGFRTPREKHRQRAPAYIDVILAFPRFPAETRNQHFSFAESSSQFGSEINPADSRGSIDQKKNKIGGGACEGAKWL
jgi:hypothetical protein